MAKAFSQEQYLAGTTALGKELGITRVAAWKMIDSGRVSAIKMGNIFLIPTIEVRKLKKIYNPGKTTK